VAWTDRLVTAGLAGVILASAAPAWADEVLIADGALVPTNGGVETRGQWATTEGVRLQEGAPGHMDVIVQESPAFYSGTVTAVVELGTKPYVTVLARVHHRTAPEGFPVEGLSAIGVTLRGQYLRIDRWDDGVTLPLARSLRSHLRNRTVRVELSLKGDLVEAEVFDHVTGGLIARTAVLDRGSGTGGIGVRVQGDTDSRVRELSARSSDAPDKELVPGNANAPTDERRFILVSAEDAARAAQAHADSPDNHLRDWTVLGEWPYDDRGLHGMLVKRSAGSHLPEVGVQVREKRALIPFWAWDADVRAAAGQVPLDDGWPVLSASYKDPQMVEQVLDAWVAKRPDIARKTLLTVSHQQRPVWALRITDHPERDESDEPAVLITGATHGSELLSTEYALDAAERLLKGYGTQSEQTRRVDELDIWVVPLVNPDGNHHVHTVTRYGGRKNGRPTWVPGGVTAWGGVDLNRNFPLGFGRDEGASRSFPNSAYYRGPAPLSEPESQAIAQLARQRHFAASLSFHTNGSMILVPYTLDGVQQPQPNAAWTVAEQIAAATPRQPNGKALRVRRQLYPVDGTDQDWLRHAFGTVAFIVEGSHHNPEERAVRLASIAALRPVVPTLLDRVLEGPRLTVHTVDASGQPVVARIDVAEEELRAGEVWTTRPGDGRHDRLLARPGTVHVTASAEGYQDATATVEVKPLGQVRLVMERE